MGRVPGGNGFGGNRIDVHADTAALLAQLGAVTCEWATPLVALEPEHQAGTRAHRVTGAHEVADAV